MGSMASSVISSDFYLASFGLLCLFLEYSDRMHHARPKVLQSVFLSEKLHYVYRPGCAVYLICNQDDKVIKKRLDSCS